MNRLREDLTINQQHDSNNDSVSLQATHPKTCSVTQLGSMQVAKEHYWSPNLKRELVGRLSRWCYRLEELCWVKNKSSWLRTVLTDLYVRFSLWKRNITFSLNRAAYLLVGVRMARSQSQALLKPTVHKPQGKHCWSVVPVIRQFILPCEVGILIRLPVFSNVYCLQLSKGHQKAGQLSFFP